VNCRTEVVEPAGSDTFVVTRLGGKDVVARMRSDAAVKLHSAMDFAYNMDRAVLFDPASGDRVA
jgi:multiple sugar transport system ATP-binding protein